MTTGMVNQAMMANSATGGTASVQQGQDSGNFMATLMSALGGQNTLGEADLLNSLITTGNHAFGSEEDGLSNQDMDLSAAMEMMSAMLFGAQNFAATQPEAETDFSAQMAAIFANSHSVSNIAAVETEPTSQNNPSVENLFAELMNLSGQKTDEPMEVVYKLLQENQALETVPQNSADIFEKAIAQVKNRLGLGQATEQTEGKSNLEALQSAAENGTFLNPAFARTTAAVNQLGQTTFNQIISQVKTGIVENLNTEKQSELIIKLRPEGLGEVTVKMVETAGKISLSISANSQYAQNAISSELNTLREALKPYNAEVSQTVAYDAGNFSQGFGGQASHQQQQSKQQYYFDGEETTEDITSKQQYVQAFGAALNQYI